jgi:hypothetical protein
MTGSVVQTNNVLNSITRQARTEPFDLQVARGQITGHTALSIFGYQATVSNVSIPIWENATAYTFATSATALSIASSSASDVSPAAVTISGLDINFNPISENVVLTGTSVATTINSYYRVNSLVMSSVASGQTSNAGVITAKQGSNILGQINTGIGKSQSSVYTVPNGYTLYLSIIEVNTSNSYTSSNIVTYRVQATDNNSGVTRTVLQQPFVSIYTINRSTEPFAYTSKTDVQWQLSTSTTTAIAAGLVLTGKLIKNQGEYIGY